MKVHCRNRYREEEPLVLTSTASLSTAIDRMIVAVVSFGCVAFIGIFWVHMTASANMVAVQTLQALASLATIASVVWTMFRTNPDTVVKQATVSAKAFKCLFLMIAGGMLIGSLNPGISDVMTFLCSLPISKMARTNCSNVIAQQEHIPTSEEYLMGPMSK